MVKGKRVAQRVAGSRELSNLPLLSPEQVFCLPQPVSPGTSTAHLLRKVSATVLNRMPQLPALVSCLKCLLK
jgi:hypothetical protein